MLKIENLKKHYDNFFLECSLQVNPGQVTGLIGQNGSGKSTTFKAILDLIHPDGGSITLFGKDNQDITPEDKEKLGVVLSDSGFSGYLRIKDIIPILENMYRQFDSSFFIKQVQRFSLPMDKQIKGFSTGMKAKLKVLVAISHNAQLLILDEPTAGLDVIARDELLDMLRKNKDNYIINNIVDEYIEYLSIGISNLIDIFEPEAVSIGGSFVYFADVLLDKLKNNIQKKKYLFNTRKELIIIPAALGNDAGIIGACQ